MTECLMTTGAPLTSRSWTTIDWSLVEKLVRKLQMRIAKAAKIERHGKVKALQWILSHSYYAKLLAVKRVTQARGRNTAGTDGVTWCTPLKKIVGASTLKRRGYRSAPLRRIYIPKRNGKKRPLSIPTMRDRAIQALHLLGLEPVAEMLLDKNSYGFRPKRSTADAIGQCFITLSKKKSAKHVLEGDIRACFDTINHEWMLKNIPMDKKVLEQFLKAGVMEKGKYQQTVEGTPQGGVISPCIMNLALSGLEKEVKSSVKKTDKVNIIIYADDFIITGASEDVLEKKVKPVVEDFLHKRGLELSEEKTRITHIDTGFDFLGFNVRKYKEKAVNKAIER